MDHNYKWSCEKLWSKVFKNSRYIIFKFNLFTWYFDEFSINNIRFQLFWFIRSNFKKFRLIIIRPKTLANRENDCHFFRENILRIVEWNWRRYSRHNFGSPVNKIYRHFGDTYESFFENRSSRNKHTVVIRSLQKIIFT